VKKSNAILFVVRNITTHRIVLLLFLFHFTSVFSQLTPYKQFSNQWVVFSDIGTTTAPFRLTFDSENGEKKLLFRHNYRLNFGMGFSFKWLSLRLSLPLPGYMRSVDEFGKSKLFLIGTDFTLKNFVLDGDVRYVQGYALKDGINDTLLDQSAHLIRPDIRVVNVAFNTWYFRNEQFKISAFRGKTAHYQRQVISWYVKGSFAINSLYSSDDFSLIPAHFVDAGNSKTSTPRISSVDLSAIPGFAFVDRKSNFQYGILAGFGAAVQQKGYYNGYENRSFLGLVPRYDISFALGFNNDAYFLMMINEFDNKMIRLDDLRYAQTVYFFRLSGGFRFPERKKKERGQIGVGI
jgi:hypothetical protein